MTTVSPDRRRANSTRVVRDRGTQRYANTGGGRLPAAPLAQSHIIEDNSDLER
ncbi:MAG TPA: hypothetical protein VMT22_04800 [Terriglobales bacterium]|nr:hypothetical protein [Terriglobales bacterium]